MYIIEYACLRNRLLDQYPEFEFFIKEVSAKNGMYRPGKRPMSPLSLKCLSASNVFFNKKIPDENSKTLPAELKEYILKLDEIQCQLNKIMSPGL